VLEIAVYIFLLDTFSKNPQLFGDKFVVKDRIIGSMMFNLIFIPGVAMLIGGLFYFQQTMNRFHVSTSNLLLFVSIVIFCISTLFQVFVIDQYYGNLKYADFPAHLFLFERARTHARTHNTFLPRDVLW
jgi:Ca2+/H+ antiporter